MRGRGETSEGRGTYGGVQEACRGEHAHAGDKRCETIAEAAAQICESYRGVTSFE